MLRVEILLPAMVLLLALSTGTAASRRMQDLAVSIADAQEHGVFLRTVHLTPVHRITSSGRAIK